eukprot:2089774-Prymnesium_polylepis.1
MGDHRGPRGPPGTAGTTEDRDGVRPMCMYVYARVLCGHLESFEYTEAKRGVGGSGALGAACARRWPPLTAHLPRER